MGVSSLVAYLTDRMKLVFLLGVLSLMALSTSAQPEMSLTALNRGVRQASQEAHGKGSLRRGSKARKGGKNRKTAKRRELKGEKGEKRQGGNGKKIRGKNVRKGKKKKKQAEKEGKETNLKEKRE